VQRPFTLRDLGIGSAPAPKATVTALRKATIFLFLTVASGLVLPAFSAAGPANAVRLQRASTTYLSPDYGFAIDYPKNVTFRGRHPDSVEMKSSYIPICVQSTVACFEYSGHDYTDTSLESAGLSINVLRDLRTEHDCYQIPTPSSPGRFVSINGTKFWYAETGDAGAGHGASGSSYRAFYQNVCFEVSALVVQTTARIGEPGIRPLDNARLEKLLDEMAHTFRFTGEVLDGPNWWAFDGQCGGESFEYPDAATVVIDDNASGGWTLSGVACSEQFSSDGSNFRIDLITRPELNEWLASANLPALSSAQVVRKSKTWTEYHAGPYFYFVATQRLYVLSVTKLNNVRAQRAFSHFVGSFRPD
jgi:hypothetical protein